MWCSEVLFTDVEEKALRAVIDPAHLPELDIALGTGMRLSEQFELTWDQVDFVGHEVRLSKTKNFSGRPRLAVSMDGASAETHDVLGARSVKTRSSLCPRGGQNKLPKWATS